MSEATIAIEVNAIDVNKILREHYTGANDFRMTRTMLWDMETRKAKRPDIFIPSTIKEGSAFAWGEKNIEGDDILWRVSDQRLWLDENERGKVIEEVYLNNTTQNATFIGRRQITDSHGITHRATPSQPIFHVTHGVSGDENSPLNTWKIVLETQSNEAAFRERVQKMNATELLPEYIEIYIREILGMSIERKI